jgi:hypothetical protein
MMHEKMPFSVDREWEHESRALIAVAEAGWKGSPCWHVFEWMCWKQRCRVFRERDRIINWDTIT